MHSPKRVGLVLHPRRDSEPAVKAIEDWARRNNHTLVGVPGEVDRIGYDIEQVEPGELSGLDLLISLGGDGTMLRALRLSQPRAVPVLGVNLGRLGFLAEIDVPDLPDALTEIDAGNSTVETRVAVQVDFDDSTAFAFNDVAVVRHPGQPVAAVEVKVEGQPFVRYAADAIVIATPTGSTAYSFSAGGPIVSPRAEGLLVIPVAPHSAFNRAVFLSAGEPVGLDLLPTSGRLAVEVDGLLAGTVEPGQSVNVFLCARAGRVVRLGTTTFYQRARRKLRLADPAELDEVDVTKTG
ncbi:MAG TPA: NAD(+)/NADH kinase [Mycobacteriales bacterium]|jgi:NAD+ kinase|nr:NAD(+)/NADH kinase [Mycobacteriales bacterium]